MLKTVAGRSARLLQTTATPLVRPAVVRSFSSSPISSSSKPAPPTPPQPPAGPSSRPDVPSSKPHLTPKEASDKATEEKGTKPAPFLSRALGVVEPPSKAKRSREEWRADLLNKEKRLEERRHLVKEVARGYFHDYNELRHQGGKAYMSPKTLIRDELALYFPNIEGISLATKEKVHTTDLFENKVSLVAFSSFRSAEEHINSFVRPTLADLKGDPNFQYVYINLQENPLKSFLVSMFLSSLRKQVPEEYHQTYLLSHQSLEYLRDPLGMPNKHVGYVFLVDWRKKIRWAGCGWATVEEEEALRRCAHVLTQRLKQGGDKEVPVKKA
ncbi:Mitochondrial ATPase complex subunit atp10 [Rhodotorula toruloides]|uniref:ATP10 protein-domain containing protein n=1 Tax=Rhodotorula toruloides TaxID=5286 RepID=A0A0K3C8B1_RHOTO|nr:ATP10 protein-domain containing protein [Rhodotorula toruloides]